LRAGWQKVPRSDQRTRSRRDVFSGAHARSVGVEIRGSLAGPSAVCRHPFQIGLGSRHGRERWVSKGRAPRGRSSGEPGAVAFVGGTRSPPRSACATGGRGPEQLRVEHNTIVTRSRWFRRLPPTSTACAALPASVAAHSWDSPLDSGQSRRVQLPTPHAIRGRRGARARDPRKAGSQNACCRRESPPIPAQPGSAMTGLSRRRSRVRVPSLP
jgi:hypothetical protein